MRKSVLRMALVPALWLALGPLCEAGTISSITWFALPGFSTGSLNVPLPAAPNNDNTASSPNTIAFSIFFNSGGLGPADLEFGVANSGGTTEYLATLSGFGLVNNTGIPFTGFLAQLGFGTGTAFVLSTEADALDFDTLDRDPAPQSSSFPTLTHDPDTLHWSGGVVPSPSGFTLGFSFDVSDGLPSDRFTLRLTPLADTAVPEPATSLLVLLGLSSIALVRSRRRLRG